MPHRRARECVKLATLPELLDMKERNSSLSAPTANANALLLYSNTPVLDVQDVLT